MAGKVYFQQLGGDWAKGEMDADEFFKNKAPATEEDIKKFMGNERQVHPGCVSIADLSAALMGKTVAKVGKNISEFNDGLVITFSDGTALEGYFSQGGFNFQGKPVHIPQ